MSLAGKTIVVTGASSGIGEATARLLAERGASVVLAARRRSALDGIVAEIAEHGGTALAAEADVARYEDVRGAVEVARRTFGRLDGYVSNAGVATSAPLREGRLEDWNAMIDVNLRGVLHGIKAALPVFEEQREGHFVTVTSTSAIKWVPGQAVYAATKAGTRALCEVLRQETAPEIRATMICPGATRTEFTRDPEMRERYSPISMEPEAVARAIAYALDEPGEVDVGEIVIRSSRQP